METLPPKNIVSSPIKLSGRQRRWQWLVAPLMGFSVILHIALLFLPLPTLTPSEAEEAEEAAIKEAQKEAINILSLSDIEVPGPPTEPSLEQSQQPATQSASPLDPPQVPESLPEPLAKEPLPKEPLPVDDGLPQAPKNFDPTRRQAILNQSAEINAESDQTPYFPLYAWNPDGFSPAEDSAEYASYLAGWQPQRYKCFFSSIDELSYQLDPRADRLMYFKHSYDSIVNQDLPRTFADQEVIREPNGYCSAALFTMYEGGVAAGIYVSAIGVGLSNDAVILIFWTADPRQ